MFNFLVLYGYNILWFSEERLRFQVNFRYSMSLNCKNLKFVPVNQLFYLLVTSSFSFSWSCMKRVYIFRSNCLVSICIYFALRCYNILSDISIYLLCIILYKYGSQRFACSHPNSIIVSITRSVCSLVPCKCIVKRNFLRSI